MTNTKNKSTKHKTHKSTTQGLEFFYFTILATSHLSPSPHTTIKLKQNLPSNKAQHNTKQDNPTTIGFCKIYTMSTHTIPRLTAPSADDHIFPRVRYLGDGRRLSTEMRSYVTPSVRKDSWK